MELDYKAIGKRIKIARIQKDMTQEKLAEAIELSPTHLSNIERGCGKISLTTLVNIANALSVTVDDLLCDNVIKCKPQFEKDMYNSFTKSQKEVHHKMPMFHRR